MIHYGGHGVVHGGAVQAVLNDPSQPLYALEKSIRMLSKVPGGYIIALLDCCRSHW